MIIGVELFTIAGVYGIWHVESRTRSKQARKPAPWVGQKLQHKDGSNAKHAGEVRGVVRGG